MLPTTKHHLNQKYHQETQLLIYFKWHLKDSIKKKQECFSFVPSWEGFQLEVFVFFSILNTHIVKLRVHIIGMES